jgi:hypothetical protein
LRVTAERADGTQATDERHIIVDYSSYANVPVRVALDGDPDEIIPGVPVQASTWLYNWRSRSTSAASDDLGIALLNIEALGEAPTKHIIQVEPIVVDGVFYQGTEAVELILPPGASSADLITLMVTAEKGRIDGEISGGEPGIFDRADINAIRLPEGSVFHPDKWEKGVFEFSNLSIAEYILALDHTKLVEAGYTHTPIKLDLPRLIQASAEIRLKAFEGQTLSGMVSDESGSVLPFAWITSEIAYLTGRVYPHNGKFYLQGIPQDPITLFASAPGYFSAALPIELQSESPDGINFQLVQQPGTTIYPWGDGQVIIPGETQVEVGEDYLSLDQGWLWGDGGDASAMIIHTSAADISIPSGKFAIEVQPQNHWLYLFDGSAEVRRRAEDTWTPVKSDQMVNLSNNQGLQPVEYDPGVLFVLQSATNPIGLTWEPTLSERIITWFTRIGVGSAQALTFITYAFGFLALVIAPVAAIYSWWKDRKPPKLK